MSNLEARWFDRCPWGRYGRLQPPAHETAELLGRDQNDRRRCIRRTHHAQHNGN
jgi:hypothetical protein